MLKIELGSRLDLNLILTLTQSLTYFEEMKNNESMPERLKGADCKSAALCYVGSNPTRFKQSTLFNKFYLLNSKHILKNKI